MSTRKSLARVLRRLWPMVAIVFGVGGIAKLSVTVFAASSPLTALESRHEWLTYRADETRTGSSQMLIGSQVTTRWTHVISGLVATEPVLADNRVYIGSWGGYLYALDAVDGHEIWRTFLGTYLIKTSKICPPGIMGVDTSATLDPSTNTLYLAAADSTKHMTLASDPNTDPPPFLYAVDAANGAILWRVQIGTSGDEFAWSSPLITGGMAYVGLASAGDCPLTHGQLVAVDLNPPHAIHRASTAPDALTVYPNTTPALLPDGSDWDFGAELTFFALSPTTAQMRLILRHLTEGQTFQPQLMTGTCGSGLTFVQNLGSARVADASGVLTYTGVVPVNTASLVDGQHALFVNGAVFCSRIELGTGGGIWSSPTYDPASHSVYVTTGTATPPCIPQTSCTGRASVYGLLNPAVVALDATTLAVKGYWQVPMSQQVKDADFGATPTLCTGRQNTPVLGVGNKDGYFYAFNTSTPDRWQTAGPLWQRQVAEGGADPEIYGVVSSAACANGVFYVGTGQPMTGTHCQGYAGQVWALDAASGMPVWPHPHCTSMILGPMTASSGLLVYGANCRGVGCQRRMEILDATMGNTRYLGTNAQLSGLGDIISGVAVGDHTLVFGDTSIYGPNPYFPLTSTVRLLSTFVPTAYIPVAIRQ